MNTKVVLNVANASATTVQYRETSASRVKQPEGFIWGEIALHCVRMHVGFTFICMVRPGVWERFQGSLTGLLFFLFPPPPPCVGLDLLLKQNAKRNMV